MLHLYVSIGLEDGEEEESVAAVSCQTSCQNNFVL